MPPWLQLVLASAGSIFASAGFWAYIQKRDLTRSSVNRLLMALAYDKIVSVGVMYIERGWISKDEYEDLQRGLYEPYKDIGGNGMAERIMSEVRNLPLRSQPKYTEIAPSDRERR